MKKNTQRNSILAQWEKLTGKRAISRRAKNECFACYHESRVALVMAELKRKNARQKTGA